VSDVRERLRRLLLLVPYVSRHPGISVERLAQVLGLTVEQLLADLDLITLVGRPPFSPDDFVDLSVKDGRVYVHLDQRLSKPPRLTAAEAAALAAAAHHWRAAGGETLKSAVSKLERVLPEGALSRFREMEKKLDLSADGPPELGLFSQAIAERREIRFRYFTPNRGASEVRTVRPAELFSHRGQWYLSAFCLSRKDSRLFRLDRALEPELTEARFEPDELAVDSSRAIPNPAVGAGGVRVQLSQAAAPYVQERFGQDCRPCLEPWAPGEPGGVEVTVAGDSMRWLTSWVLSFGGEARVLEPDAAREAVAAAARATLDS
jgi:proteasome accessory factor C